MKNNIMSYDAIVGARYYGIGNEYEGVSIASPIFAFAILLNYNKKLPKWSIVIASIVILITSAYPTMGANVGGAISESVAYLLFIMLIFDVKLDFKKGYITRSSSSSCSCSLCSIRYSIRERVSLIIICKSNTSKWTKYYNTNIC